MSTKQVSSSSVFISLVSLLLMALVILIHTSSVQAENSGYRFVSVKTMLGPCCTDQGNDLLVDSDGGVLVAGSRGGLDLDRDGSVDIQTFGSPDPLIFKHFDKNNNKDGWVQGPGGPKADTASGIASDRHGGAYAVGNFTDSMRIAGGTIQSAGKIDGFLVRYNQKGQTQWAIPIGSSESDELVDVASDSDGNIFVVGTIRGQVDIDRDGKIDVASEGESSILLASFTPNGDLRWANASAGNVLASGRAIALGPNGEIYIGGIYYRGAPDLNRDGTPDLPPTTDNSSPVTGQTDINGFFARYDSSGKMIWAKSVAGPAVQSVGSLSVIGNGDLIVLGGYTGSVDLNGESSSDLEFKSMGKAKYHKFVDGIAFLLRVSPEGKTIWARRYMAAPVHVASEAKRIVISGTYTETLDLDDDGVAERAADPDKWLEGFAAILDGDGRVQHVFTIVGDDSDVANAAGFSPDGKKLYVTGYTRLGADFDNDNKLESASACHQKGDLFLSSYDVE